MTVKNSTISKYRSSSTRMAVAACLLLLGGIGFVHRYVLDYVNVAVKVAEPLRRSLSTLPMQIGAWQGEDVAMDEITVRVAGEDQYLNRRYTNSRNGKPLYLYVGYLGRPRSWLGHRADVCYTSQGWDMLSQKEFLIKTKDGKEISSLVYEFLFPSDRSRHQVLAIYLINGRYVNDQSVVSYNIRHPNLFGGKGAYMARIQISINASRSYIDDRDMLGEFASLIAEPIAEMMPHFEN